jgi:hypothetical protein
MRSRYESQPHKDARLQKAATRTLRRISGWNVFQRSKFKGQALSVVAYKAAVAELSKQWNREMSDEDKAKYCLQAEYENTCRDQLQLEPLPTVSDTHSDDALGAVVGKRACKKISFKRMQPVFV